MHGSLANDGRYWLDGMTTNSADVLQRALRHQPGGSPGSEHDDDGAGAEVQTSGSCAT